MSDRDLERVQTKVCARRREQPARDWRQHPVSKYETELYDSLTKSDAETQIQAVRRFEEWLLTEIAAAVDEDIQGVRDAVERDVEHWRDNDLLPDTALSPRTIEDYLGHLSAFYRRLDETKAYAGNPVETPLSRFRDEYSNEIESNRPYIPRSRIETFLNWLDTPFARLAWLLAFKLALREGEAINLDLRCLNIDHPVFREIRTEHDVILDPRVQDRPDTLVVYGKFNENTEVPHDGIPGWEGAGEIRKSGNKRKQPDGSVLPIDSELKTAFIEWLLVREPTPDLKVNPVFTIGAASPRRMNYYTMNNRLWAEDSYIDSIQRFSADQELEECPTCGEPVVSRNLTNGEKTGRRYRCQNCSAVHWRSIHWGPGLDTEQKMTYHQGRHTFSSAHTAQNSALHEGVIPKAIRTNAIRGDSNQDGDTEDEVYVEDQYQEFDEDVRQKYLDGIYKFGLYENPIPAVGER